MAGRARVRHENSALVLLTFVVIVAFVIGANVIAYLRLSQRNSFDSIQTPLISLEGYPTSVRQVSQGQRRIVLFVRDGGAHSVRTIQNLSDAMQGLGRQRVAAYVVGVGNGSTLLAVESACADRLPFYSDPSGEAASQAGVRHFPTLVFADENGRIRGSKIGETSVQLLQAKLPHFAKTGQYLPDPTVSVGQTAPDFAGVLLPDGPFGLGRLKGNRILLVFSEMDCQYCHRLWTFIDHVSEKQGVKTFIVIPDSPIILKDTRQGELVEIKATQIPVVAVSGYAPFEAYGVQTVPTLIWVNEQGQVENIHRGYMGQRRLEKTLMSRSGLVEVTFERGELIPDFALPDVRGNSWDRERLRGKKTMLVFGTSDCPACQMLIDYMRTQPYDSFGQLVYVLADQPEAAKSLVSGINSVLLIDDQRIVTMDFEIRYTPTIFLVNSDLTVHSVYEGFQQEELKTAEAFFKGS